MFIDKIDRVGESRENTYGTLMTIIQYDSYDKITVEFQDDHHVKVNTTYSNFKSGQIKNPYDRTVFGIGYLGEGIYMAKKNKKSTPEYLMWMSMLQRCYAEKWKDKFPAYYGICTVCDEWHNFQNFAKWYFEHYYEVAERLHLDKDILIPNNKVYAPDRCLLVPQRINMLFMCKPNKYGLPSGVKPYSHGRFEARYNEKRLGFYKSVEEAAVTHDNEKKKNIVQIANEYKNQVSEEVYQALINWTPCN